MKVSQLIEALQQMPPDAEVLTHADNHTVSGGGSMRVGLAMHVWGKESWPRVIVGNWSEYSLRCWRGTHIVMADDSLAVLCYGEDKGNLVRQRHTFQPKRIVQRTRTEEIEERFELETVK